MDDATQKLRIGSAKSLSASYNALVDNMPLGHGEGSCATACYTALPVYVSDMRTDPLWAKYREVFSTYKWLKSCWSTPFFDIQKKVLGSFAIYGNTCRQPSLDEKELMNFAASLAGIIIERFKNQEAYTKQATFFHTLVNTIPDMIWLKDINGVYLGCNPTFERFFGAKEDQIIGKTDYDFVNPELADLFRLNDKVAIEANAPSMNEEWITFADDGHEALNETIKVPMLDKSGEVIGILGISHDITERKNIESALFESKENLRLFIDHAPVALAMFDNQMRYLAVSRRWLSDYRLEGIDVLGQSHYEVFPEITEDLKEIHLRALNGEIIKNDNGRFVRLDGSVQWLKWEVRPWYKTDGSIGGIALFSEDITALKQSESHYRTLFERTGTCIAVIERDGTISLMNEQFSELSEVSKEELIGSSFFNLIDETDKERMREYHALRSVDSSLPNHYEFNFVNAKGRKGIAEIHAVYLSDTKQTIVSVIDITEQKKAQTALIENERFLNASQSIAKIGSYMIDMQSLEFTTSETMDQIFDIDKDYKHNFEGWTELIHPDDRLRMNEYFINEVATKHQSFDKEYRIVSPSSKEVKWVHGLGKLEFQEDGTLVRMFGTIQDITKSKQMVASLHKLSLAVEQSPNAIVITDTDGNIEYVNTEFTRNTGYSPDEVIGENPRILQSHQTASSTYDDMWEHLTKGEIWKGELINQRKDKSVYIESAIIAPVKEEDGKVTNYIAIKEDITNKKRAEEYIENLAHFDQLTGLANRTLLNDRVSYLLGMAKRTQKHFTVMFLDLDHFKNINDSLGHTLGDKVLIETAKRIKGLIRVEDTVARLGGDEFILIFPETDSNAAIHVATKLIEEISKPSIIELHELTITPSIGIAIYPDDGEDFDTLLKNADTAMYKVKNDSRNNFHFFTQEMQKNSARNLELSNALRHALKRGELELYYQPQIAIEDGRVIGAEALLRWNHPVLGMISPAEFIPIAEDSGQIIEIGTWVLRTALLEMKRWIESGFDPLIVAVNISAIQFKQPNFSKLIIDALQEIEVPHKCLELELTEAVAMHNPKTVITIMNQLHDLGIRMSIDDFGTGYSSLSYLKQFKVYKLKIDQSFIHDIATDGDDRSIVSAIIDMANNLGLQTIAEGVETAEQLSFLRLHGCNEIQGYYFSKPLRADDFMKFVVNNKHQQ